MARPALPEGMTPRRAATLTRVAETAGADWAKSEREALHAEKRRAEGGWPGTFSQARDRVRGVVDNGVLRLSYDEATWMARTIYECARRAWLDDADPPVAPHP